MSEEQLSPEILVPKLGDYLVEKGLIKLQDLERALKYQETLRTGGENRLIGQILVDLKIIDSATRDAVITERITHLREALQEANQQLLQANQQLEKRVEERTAELQRAMIKLAEINELKANLVANISHELRTPLTHLKGYLELLSAGDLGPLTQQQKSAVQTMERSGERLSRLIEDLILFSVSERDKIQLQIGPVPVQRLCSSAINKTGKKAVERSINLVLDCEKDLPHILGDEEKLGWVILQLLDNAIKFTQPGGTVRLGAQHTQELVEIYVQDTGIGIPSTRTEEIFESFYQLDGSSTRRAGGTGLGLALAKKIVDAHGSVIRVSSEVGKGSCFSFSIKLYPDTRPEP